MPKVKLILLCHKYQWFSLSKSFHLLLLVCFKFSVFFLNHAIILVLVGIISNWNKLGMNFTLQFDTTTTKWPYLVLFHEHDHISNFVLAFQFSIFLALDGLFCLWSQFLNLCVNGQSQVLINVIFRKSYY